MSRHADMVRMGNALEMLIMGIESYIHTHKRMFDSDIADDYLFGPAILAIAQSTRDLLNGERGNLDGGDAWRRLNQALIDAGYLDGLDTESGSE